MNGTTRRGLAAGLVLAAAVVMAGCPSNDPVDPPEEFAWVVVDSVGGLGGGPSLWAVELFLRNEEGNGQYVARFLTGDATCSSETFPIFVSVGRVWSDIFNVSCRAQPIEVVLLSQRAGGAYQVTDRDSIPLVSGPE